MILLDTHVVVWLAYEPEKLSSLAVKTIQKAVDAKSGLAISAVTLYEIVWLIEQGRLRIPVAPDVLLERIAALFSFLPVTSTIALRAARLPRPLHGDPMDRILIATALENNTILVTADQAILASNACKLLW